MTSTLRVGEALVELLVGHYGVDTVFGIPGVHNIELYRGLHRSGLRLVSPRHEQGAGFMAEGWSVVTGRPGVCTLISGPGLTNALTPMAQAFHDSRPMLVLAATTPRDALGRGFGPLHDLANQAAVARTVCAFSETVLDPSDLPELIARAWEVFTAARPRPVHLAIPTDVLAERVGPFEPVLPSVRAGRPRASADDVARAARLIDRATAPVVIAGGGAVDAGESLADFAERIDAPVVLTGNAKGVLPSSHRLCAGNGLAAPEVRSAVEAADVVVVVGSELSDADLLTDGRPMSLAGTLVRIDLDVEQLDRRAAPAVGIVADAALALDALTAAVAPAGRRRGAERAAELRDAGRRATWPDVARWVDRLAEAIPDDAVVALDSTQLAYVAHVRLAAERPRSWLAPYGYGTLGCALPMAIGAKIAAPQRPVVAVVGDGGWLFTVAEMATAIDERMAGLVVVLWDNRGYGQIRQSFEDADAAQVGVDATSVDPIRIAEGFGWHTAEVGNPDDLATAVADAMYAASPVLVRVIAGHDRAGHG